MSPLRLRGWRLAATSARVTEAVANIEEKIAPALCGTSALEQGQVVADAAMAELDGPAITSRRGANLRFGR